MIETYFAEFCLAFSLVLVIASVFHLSRPREKTDSSHTEADNAAAPVATVIFWTVILLILAGAVVLALF